MKGALNYHLIILPCILLTIICFCSAGDNIKPHTFLKDGATLVSHGRNFVLGFFSLGESKNRYMGIWYVKFKQIIVWVANRNHPITDSTGVLMITSGGNLMLVQSRTNTTVWSSGTSYSRNPKAQILDSGNLIVKVVNSDKILWQSFDYPTDTLLPGMKLGIDFRIGLNRILTSWKSSDDPSPGDHIYMMDPKGSHEIYIKSMNKTTFRIGPWNGIRFSGVPSMKIYEKLSFKYVSNQREAYYTCEYSGKGVLSRLVMHPNGLLERLGWSVQLQSWEKYWSGPYDDCDSYGMCGPNSICDDDQLGVCKCLRGFTPTSPVSWRWRDFKMGCTPEVKSYCRTGEGFVPVKGVKLADITNSTINSSLSLDDCKSKCLANCSCVAYSAEDISNDNPRGCIMWNGNLVDLRKLPFGGQDMFLRVPASEIENKKRVDKKSLVMILIFVLGTTCLLLFVFFIWRKKNRKKKEHNRLSNHG